MSMDPAPTLRMRAEKAEDQIGRAKAKLLKVYKAAWKAGMADGTYSAVTLQAELREVYAILSEGP